MAEPTPPAVAPPVWDAIPAELANRQQWVLWKFEWDQGREAWLKVPYYTMGGRRTGDQGTERDRMRLATLAVVQRAFERGRGWSGVGFAFLPDDGLIGIDIDHAIDLQTGEISERCQTVIDACRSYTEFSPSGEGVHVIVKGKTQTNKSNDIGLEIFCERQYFTFTGRVFAGTPPDVCEIDAQALQGLHDQVNAAKKARQDQQQRDAAKVAKQAARPGQQDGDDFRRVNDAAMGSMQMWVTALFPDAKPRGQGYRISSKQLGRNLQEDLSIMPTGIVDFGVADMGDAKGGKRTPIDLVMEWSSAKTPKDALHWLAQRVGVEIRQPARRERAAPRANVSAPAGDAGNAGGGGGGGDGGEPPDGGLGDEEPVDVWTRLVKHRGRPMDCRENVMYCLLYDETLAGLVRQNDFTHLIERMRPTPWGHPAGEWNEEDDLMLGEYLLRTYGLAVKATSTLRNGVLMAARSAKYNPVLDLIRAQPWDGTDRLEHWLTDVYGITERPYTRLIGKCFIMGMVKRALQPGCKFDYMLIIKGEQGLKKSTAFRELAYPFFTDNAIRMGDKDSLMAMQLVWIAESAELESLNKSETTQIKQFLSAQEDMFRPPYGSQLIRAKRHAVNVGTTNADTFLKDATGDRRFWPLEVHDVDAEILKGMRLQLFAEALHRLEQGERYWPTREEERELVFPEQEPFKRTDPWEDMIDAYVNRDVPDKHDIPTDPPNAKREFFSTIEIYEKALLIKADRIDGAGNMDTRISNAMRALGFDRHRETGGKRRRGFKRRPPAPPQGVAYAAPPPTVAPGAPTAGEDDDLPL